MLVQEIHLLVEKKTNSFNEKANDLLSEGFQPSSEFSYFEESETVYLCQQFAKYKEEEVLEKVEKRKEI
jgi:ribulose bisphosphate carboxylase small subunit